MTPRRPDFPRTFTENGCWRVNVGAHGSSVTVREKAKGGKVVLQWTELKKRRERKLADTVRDGGRLIAARCRHVLAEAEALADRLAKATDSISARERAHGPLTVAGAFRIYSSSDGGLPKSRSARVNHARARRFWEREFKPGTEWNNITPAMRDAAIERGRKRYGPPSLEKFARCLRTVHRWLVDAAEIDGLKDPTRRLDFRTLTAGHEPKRPRYTQDEIAALLEVAERVDPRFALAAILLGRSGARSAALMRAKRSMVDEPLDVPPPEGFAPYGWILWPAMKQQDRVLNYLTARQLEALGRAWSRLGVLSVLEARWRERGEDYPLLPGGVLPRSGVIRRPRKPVSSKMLHEWLRKAEELAGVERVERRAWHAFRRAVADLIEQEAGVDVLVTHGGWKSREMAEGVYTQRVKHHRLKRAREVTEGDG